MHIAWPICFCTALLACDESTPFTEPVDAGTNETFVLKAGFDDAPGYSLSLCVGKESGLEGRTVVADARRLGACIRYQGKVVAPAVPEHFDLRAARLELTSLRGQHLDFGDARRASLRETDMREVKCNTSSFERSDLRGVNASASEWTKCTFAFSDMRAAKLVRARFSECDLRGARLNGAALSMATLRACDLRGADLSDAALQATDFAGSTFNETTKLPFSETEAFARGMRKAP